MHQLTFSFDPISPYAYLAFEQLPHALDGLSYSVTYRPVLFAAMLKHYGQLGPAEIAPKRDWTFRQVSFLAHNLGVPFVMLAAHPFKPLALLRLLIACDPSREGFPNRAQCKAVLQHVWAAEQAHLDADDEGRIGKLAISLGVAIDDINRECSRAKLREHSETAIREGCFGVPTITVDGKHFWGLDSLPMLRAYLQGDSAWFAQGEWSKAATLPQGVQRPR